MAASLKPISWSLPAVDCATAERVAGSFRQLASSMMAAGYHAPFIAAGFRSAADQLDKAPAPVVGDGTFLPPWNDPVEDIVPVAANLVSSATDPNQAALVFTMRSGKEVPAFVAISDLRTLGEMLLKEAGRLARLAAEKEGAA